MQGLGCQLQAAMTNTNSLLMATGVVVRVRASQQRQQQRRQNLALRGLGVKTAKDFGGGQQVRTDSAARRPPCQQGQVWAQEGEKKGAPCARPRPCLRQLLLIWEVWEVRGQGKAGKGERAQQPQHQQQQQVPSHKHQGLEACA